MIARRIGAAALIGLAAVAGYGLATWACAGRVERSPVAVLGVRVAPRPPALADGPVRNVVLCVGDGLGVAQLAAGRIRAYGPDGRLTLERLPVSGLVATHAEGALVSKSDAAATALASGHKTTNGRVGVDAAGRSLASIAERLHARGAAIGLVTTSRITDATPAAFGAHVVRRRDESTIAEELLEADFELLLGGGRRFFLPASRPGSGRRDARDLEEEARAKGYRVIEDPAALAGAGLPLLGLFADGDLAPAAPRPALAAMARFAVEGLAGTGRPFFLMIEDERLDTYGHANELAGLSRALVELDAAVAAIVDFAGRDGRTLVLVTGDHATGGLVIRPDRDPQRLRVAWSGDLHTGEPVPLFAYGPGSAAFAGLLDNTEIALRIAALLDLGGEAAR